MNRKLTTRLASALACAALALATGVAARADDPPSCSSSTAAPYSLTVTALTGPQGADVVLDVDAAAGCASAETLKKVELKVFAADGTVADVRNLTDVDSPGGVADIELGQLERDRLIEADVLVQTGTPVRTYVVRGETKTRLRPDLVVRAVQAPVQTLTTRPIDVRAEIAELNGDTAATAKVTLSWGPTPLASAQVEVPAAGSVWVPFLEVALTTPVPVELSVIVSDVTPAETDATNNTRAATVDVTENELATNRLVLESFGGYGAQFNGHLYAPITPTPPGGYGDVEAKVKALEPQLVRIFYQEDWDGNRNGQHPEYLQNYASFVKAVQLAQEAGATIEISYQSLSLATRTAPGPAMAKYADVLEDLVRNHGLTNVRWAEVGNEPNSPGGAVTLEQYKNLYDALHEQLVARGLREQIHLMAGGLVESSGDRHHYLWLKWIADPEHMGNIVDAYSEHIYWWYDKPGRLEFRLRDIHKLAFEELPQAWQKPMYLMEFGIRGYPDCGTKPSFPNRYYLPDCTEMWRTNIAAFQQMWFNVHAAQLGFTGTAKWDAYQAVYDNGSVRQQLHWMIGPASEGYPLMPTYHALSLFFHLTEREWRVIGVDPWVSNDWTAPAAPTGETADDQPEKEIAAYAGPSGELTLIGLDTNGRNLNTTSTETPAYSIGALPANTTFNLIVWNASGDGTNSVAAHVTTTAAGVARFEVPLHAAFALTTVPVA